MSIEGADFCMLTEDELDAAPNPLALEAEHLAVMAPPAAMLKGLTERDAMGTVQVKVLRSRPHKLDRA